MTAYDWIMVVGLTLVGVLAAVFVTLAVLGART